jgi:hypothetical protein
MDIIRLYQDYGVSFLTEGHKHCREGWVNTPCPFCTGNPGYHLGYNMEGNFYVCWRCGWHPVLTSIAELIHLSEKETIPIVKYYGILIPSLPKQPKIKVKPKEFKLPPNILEELTWSHALYLMQRDFDPDEIHHTWGIVSSGPASVMDGINYRNRIIIPFYWNKELVSFDSRAPNPNSDFRYIACPISRELIPHKEIIYCKQEGLQDTAICVEGPTDVWRLGVRSFAVSGIKYTPKQVRLIARMFKKVAVVFDDDPQAKVQANKLVADLKVRGVNAFRVDIKDDPGSMKQDDADYLVKQLIK